MAVSSAIIDLTDEDDVMHVDGGQVPEETVTLSSWTSMFSNSNEHDNEQVAPDEASHKDHETMKETAIRKQHDTSKYPAIYDKPNILTFQSIILEHRRLLVVHSIVSGLISGNGSITTKLKI